MSNRSGSPYSVPRDANRVPYLLAASSSGDGTPVVLEADPSTHALLTSSSGSGGTTNTFETTGLIPKVFDAITYTATSTTVDTYKYYTGGTSGTLVATLTVTYTTSSHNTLVSAVRT